MINLKINIPAKFLATACNVAMTPHARHKLDRTHLPEKRLVSRFRGRSKKPFGI